MGFLRRIFGANKPANSPPAKDNKRRWSFTRSSRSGAYPSTKLNDSMAPTDYNLDANQRAIAVAAATAAVAEAAIVAAHAAAEVVRLTSGDGGRRTGGGGGASGQLNRWAHKNFAAVIIQSAFRGYLARRALRALKALVKLQALARGYIVRKRTADMLRRMQTLLKLQARVRSNRKHVPDSSVHYHITNLCPYPPNNDGPNAKLSELMKLDKRHAKSIDKWIEVDKPRRKGKETRSRHNHVEDDDKNDKILEVDTWKPNLNSRQNSRSLRTSKHENNEVASRTADNSPRVHSASSRLGSGSQRGGPFTPTMSECSWGFFNGYSGYPNYMANTQSSRAKFRSQSAPKQRLEFEKLYGSMKRGQGNPNYVA